MPLVTANYLGSNNEKTPRFPEKTKENTGFLFSEVDGGRTRNLRIDSPEGNNENTGCDDTLQQIQQQSESSDAQNAPIIDEKTMCLSVAIDSVRNSRLAVEKLLGSIPVDDHHSLGILGPIMASLRDAEREIGSI